MNRDWKISIIVISIVAVFSLSVYSSYYYAYGEGYNIGYQNGQYYGYGTGYVHTLSAKGTAYVMYSPDYSSLNFTLNLSLATPKNGYYEGSVYFLFDILGYNILNDSTFKLNQSSTGTIDLILSAGPYKASSGTFNLNSSTVQGIFNFNIPVNDLKNYTGYLLVDIQGSNIAPLEVYCKAPLNLKVYS